jgi:hypothetical protein
MAKKDSLRLSGHAACGIAIGIVACQVLGACSSPSATEVGPSASRTGDMPDINSYAYRKPRRIIYHGGCCRFMILH